MTNARRTDIASDIYNVPTGAAPAPWSPERRRIHSHPTAAESAAVARSLMSRVSAVPSDSTSEALTELSRAVTAHRVARRPFGRI